MKTRASLLTILTLSLAISRPSPAATSSPNLPDYWPACANPQRLGPRMAIGSTSVSGGTTLAWNGREFGSLYNDNATLTFRRLFADGTPGGPATSVAPLYVSGSYRPPRLLWNGAGYAAVWYGFDLASSQFQTYFALLSETGAVTAGPLRVSFYGQTPTAYSWYPTLAREPGGRYLVAWSDFRSGINYDINYSILSAAGAVIVADTVLYTGVSTNDYGPTAAWPGGGDRFLIFWQDATNSNLRRSSVDRFGTPVGINGAVVIGSGNPQNPELIANDAGAALVWEDGTANSEVKFTRLNTIGDLQGPQPNLSNSSLYSYTPTVTWNGVEYGVFWYEFDNASGQQVWFTRVSDTSSPLGSPVKLFQSDNSQMYVGAAFGRLGYGVTVRTGGTNGYLALGCAAETTSPTCAGGYVAYSLTGTTATIGWLPGDDSESDLAYYNIYRNATLVGQTSNNYFNDSGLGLSTTYGYAIQPVNAAQLRNSSCTNLLYLKTNSSLTLTMNKSNPDAVLNWTDAGFNNYNVFRGTRPQVMQQIGATPSLTTQDPNALNDNLNYFYTVDDPGQ